MPDASTVESGVAPILETQGLDVRLGRGEQTTHAVREATFQVLPGEAVGLIGETGSGKSTIARAVLGLVRPSAGSIRLDGQETTSLKPREWRQLRRRGLVQLVFQDPLRSLDPDLSVAESVGEPLELAGSVRRADRDARVVTALERVNLDPDVASRFPSELSGGQRQRVAVARGLITEPRLLILDEPVSALDSANRVAVLELLAELRGRVAMLFISHDLGSVAGVTDRTIVLRRGEIVEDAPTPAIINAPGHAYTRLLVASAPTLRSGSADRARRRELRESV